MTCTLSREKDDSLTSKNYLRLRLRQYIVANVPSSKTVKSIKKGGLSSQQKKIKLGIRHWHLRKKIRKEDKQPGSHR